MAQASSLYRWLTGVTIQPCPGIMCPDINFRYKNLRMTVV